MDGLGRDLEDVINSYICQFEMRTEDGGSRSDLGRTAEKMGTENGEDRVTARADVARSLCYRVVAASCDRSRWALDSCVWCTPMRILIRYG